MKNRWLLSFTFTTGGILTVCRILANAERRALGDALRYVGLGLVP